MTSPTSAKPPGTLNRTVCARVFGSALLTVCIESLPFRGCEVDHGNAIGAKQPLSRHFPAMPFAIPCRCARPGCANLVFLDFRGRGAWNILHDVDEARHHEI